MEDKKTENNGKAPRDKVVNVRFTDGELRELDGLRGASSRSEYLRDLAFRQAASSTAAFCSDLERLESALLGVQDDIHSVQVQLFVEKERLKRERYMAQDRGEDPDSVKVPVELAALVDLAEKLIAIIEGIDFGSAGCGRAVWDPFVK